MPRCCRGRRPSGPADSDAARPERSPALRARLGAGTRRAMRVLPQAMPHETSTDVLAMTPPFWRSLGRARFSRGMGDCQMESWQAALECPGSDGPTAVSMDLYINTVKSATGLVPGRGSADGVTAAQSETALEANTRIPYKTPQDRQPDGQGLVVQGKVGAAGLPAMELLIRTADTGRFKPLAKALAAVLASSRQVTQTGPGCNGLPRPGRA